MKGKLEKWAEHFKNLLAAEEREGSEEQNGEELKMENGEEIK